MLNLNLGSHLLSYSQMPAAIGGGDRKEWREGVVAWRVAGEIERRGRVRDDCE